jgi:hypothetical protein
MPYLEDAKAGGTYYGICGSWISLLPYLVLHCLEKKRIQKIAIISVEGGYLSREEVKKQLERLFLGKWVWELKAHEENTF